MLKWEIIISLQWNRWKNLKDHRVVEWLVKGLFDKCSSLTSITLHDNYKEMKEWDFEDCKSLSSIILPSTLTKLGCCAFYGCSSLTSINLENVKVFGNDCFDFSGIRKEKYPHLSDDCWYDEFFWE